MGKPKPFNKPPLFDKCISYLYHLGYGKDGISLILGRGYTTGQIDRALKEMKLSRTPKEALEVRAKNNVIFNQGYDAVRARVKILFPGIIS